MVHHITNEQKGKKLMDATTRYIRFHMSAHGESPLTMQDITAQRNISQAQHINCGAKSSCERRIIDFPN